MRLRHAVVAVGALATVSWSLRSVHRNRLTTSIRGAYHRQRETLVQRRRHIRGDRIVEVDGSVSERQGRSTRAGWSWRPVIDWYTHSTSRF
jgi:hypothetical protein